MIRRAFGWLVMVMLWSACTEEEVIPRTNPRFSVAFVQSIDKTGAEFAATVYDFGSEEIIEYGFVYGRQTDLSLDRNNFVIESGVPEKEFRLKSSHSMPIGQRIFVAAFIKTASGVVYSEPYQFVSQGSDGFFLDRIGMAAEVYFGDTVRVFGRNLSRELTDYSVSIQRKPAIVIQVTPESFGVIIPSSLEFQEGAGDLQSFEMDIKVSDKLLQVNQPFKFKKPVFSLGSPPELAYSQDIVIQGGFLYDDFLRVTYVNQSGRRFDLPVKKISNTQLSVGMNALFTEPNPKLEAVIRGEKFPLAGFFKLKETKINPGQTSSFRFYSGTVKIKGENFNTILPEYNTFSVKPDLFRVNILAVKENELEISYEYKGEELGSRKTEFRMTNGGITSADPLIIEWISPGIPYILTNDTFYALYNGRSVAVGDKGYMINSEGIYEVNPQTRVTTRIANSPTPGKNPAGIFAIPVDGKIYFAGYSEEEVRLAEKLFFVFDPQTKTLRSLPKIPSPDNSFQSLVYHQGALYYQGDELDPITGQDGNIRRYRFDIATGIWQKLPDLIQPDEYSNSFPSFDYQGKTYAISEFDGGDLFRRSGLYLFNTVTFTWDFQGPLLGLDLINSPQSSFVIGDKVYLKSRGQVYLLDPKTRQVEAPESLSLSFDFGSSPNDFGVGDKFYIFHINTYWQFDPIYFNE